MEIKGVKYLVILNDWERRSFPCPLVYYNQGGIKIQRLWHSVSTSNLLIKNITLLMFFCFILTLNERIMATFYIESIIAHHLGMRMNAIFNPFVHSLSLS